MKNFTNKAKKIWAIVERALLVVAGSAAIFVSVFNNPYSIRYTALGLGIICILAGLVPMFVAYAKAVWNNK